MSVPQIFLKWYLNLGSSLTYKTGLFGWARLPIISVFIESQCVAKEGYLKEGYPVLKERVRIESLLDCESSADI